MIHKELQEGMDGQTIADLLEQANRTQDELLGSCGLGRGVYHLSTCLRLVVDLAASLCMCFFVRAEYSFLYLQKEVLSPFLVHYTVLIFFLFQSQFTRFTSLRFSSGEKRGTEVGWLKSATAPKWHPMPLAHSDHSDSEADPLRLEAAVHLGNAARVLGMQSAIEASEYSDRGSQGQDPFNQRKKQLYKPSFQSLKLAAAS